MALFPVKGNNIETWRHELMSKIINGVQIVILLIPGIKKGKCQLYDPLKRILLEEIPVVSQVVMTSTINRGNNLKNIVSKVLIQICSKIGGIPWIVDSMPLLDKPTMICGIDVYHQTQQCKKSVMGFCSSYNKTATKYWATSMVQEAIG